MNAFDRVCVCGPAARSYRPSRGRTDSVFQKANVRVHAGRARVLDKDRRPHQFHFNGLFKFFFSSREAF